MLISPPFLPQHAASSPDDDWLLQAMNVGGFGDGAYPLGRDLAWHGGAHLQAPMDGNKPLPVCAIADGTVVYVRKPTALPASQAAIDSHPLGYGGGWSDDGCVVIRHETEIGEDVAVRYFSITLHLKRIDPAVKQGQPIWRKDVLGDAGSIYGKPRLVQLEIVCDDTNLQALIGRASGTLSTDRDGRTNALFGHAYVVLPANTPFFAQKPAATSSQPAPAYTSTEIIWAGCAISRAGQTERFSATAEGVAIGHVPASTDTALFDEAVTLAAAHHAVGRDAYELLRFSRIVEPLGSATTLPNWASVAYPGGQGWANLHAAGTHAFSDADFPEACGWHIVGDDTNADSRCDSESVLNLILEGRDAISGTDRREQALAAVAQTEVQTRLSRTICKFPTEWEKGTVAARWQWLTQESPAGSGPMAGPHLQPDDFPRFKAHAEALCFWEDANVGIPATHWHFHPREFIRIFRQCGWLSAHELIQLFPRTALRPTTPQHWVSEPVTVLTGHLGQYRTDLNKACRRYGIVTPLRIAAFYANAMVETQWFGRIIEQINSTHPPRYYPWIGRGFMQLTWPDNYIKYWRFTGKNVSAAVAQHLHDAAHTSNLTHTNTALLAAEANNPVEMRSWRDNISGTADGAADSAGAYWAWSRASIQADVEPANVFASKTISGVVQPYYTSSGMGSVAATVNVGQPSVSYSSVNGIVARFQAYNTCEVVLLDTPIFPGSQGQQNNLPDNYQPRRP